MSAPEVVRFASEELTVEVLPELGARLHRLRAFGIDLLRTPDDPATHAADPIFWGAYVMAPWTNRATPGRFSVAGRTVELARNFEDGTAIHGHVFAARWERTGTSSFAVSHDGGGWPWAYSVTLDVAVDGPRLRLDYRLVNRSDAPMPGGIGIHPWWVRPVTLELAARAVHPRNGEAEVASVAPTGVFGLEGEAPASGLDATWLDLSPREVHLAWPDAGLRATLSAATDGPLHVAVATPDDPDATAVEPVTHAPWALDRFARGLPNDLRLIEPGGAIGLRLELTVASMPRA